MPARFGRGLCAITITAIIFTVYMETLFGAEAINAGGWTTLGLIALLGFFVWSTALAILFLFYRR
jgi:hypothetical protein